MVGLWSVSVCLWFDWYMQTSHMIPAARDERCSCCCHDHDRGWDEPYDQDSRPKSSAVWRWFGPGCARGISTGGSMSSVAAQGTAAECESKSASASNTHSAAAKTSAQSDHPIESKIKLCGAHGSSDVPSNRATHPCLLHCWIGLSLPSFQHSPAYCGPASHLP